MTKPENSSIRRSKVGEQRTSRKTPVSGGPRLGSSAQALRAYLKIARDFGINPAQLAIAYVTSRQFVTSNINGATNLGQLHADLRASDVQITAEIEAVHQIHRDPAP